MPIIPKRSINDYRPKSRGGSRREYYTAPGARGYDSRWRQIRAYYIKCNPICKVCEKAGRITPAEIIHHKRPIAAGGSVTDIDNLMSVCRKCHGELHRQLERG